MIKLGALGGYAQECYKWVTWEFYVLCLGLVGFFCLLIFKIILHVGFQQVSKCYFPSANHIDSYICGNIINLPTRSAWFFSFICSSSPLFLPFLLFILMSVDFFQPVLLLKPSLFSQIRPSLAVLYNSYRAVRFLPFFITECEQMFITISKV